MRMLRPALLVTLALATTMGAAALAAPNDSGDRVGRWPTLEQQLAADHVPAGSALAKLIADNQQVEMLPASERHDKLDVPAWLRVLWRKQHPDMVSQPGNPTHGYPLVLVEIHDWLVSHPSLKPGTDDSDLAKSAEATAQPEDTKKGHGHKPPQPAPVVQFQSQVSEDGIGEYSESDIRVNYWNPSQILSMSNAVGFRASTMAVAYSSDGGATWAQTTLPHAEHEDFQSDPTVDWLSDGTALGSGITVSGSGDAAILKLFAFRSNDGGAHWVVDGQISTPDMTSNDKEMLWVDHSPASPHKDTLYAVWHNGDPVFVSHRNPADGSWSGPVQVSGGETTGTGIGADVRTNQKGELYVFWPDTGLINFDTLQHKTPAQILVAKSTDGGNSFGRPVRVATTYQSFESVVPAQSNRAALVYATGGAFINGKKSQVYVAWQDLSGAKGCNTPADDPRTNVGSSCKTRIWFSRSTNGGKTWSKARMVNDRPALDDQFNPWMVVDEATGAISLMYYDTFGVERTKTNVWFQSSFDGGVTWRPAVKVTDTPSDETINQRNQYGDYNSLSGIGGNFYPSWTDRRDGHDKIWTAKILSVKGGKSCTSTDLVAGGSATGVTTVNVDRHVEQTELVMWRRGGDPASGSQLSIAVDGAPFSVVDDDAMVADAWGKRPASIVPAMTVVDLDRACDLARGGSGGCAGHRIELRFRGDGAAKAAPRVDDAMVKACH